MDNFDFLGPHLLTDGFWGQNFKNLCLDSKSASLRYYVHQFSDKMDNFDFLGPNLPTHGFGGQNFKNLRLDSESASLRCYLYQFSDKRLWIFDPKFANKWILGRIFKSLILDSESTFPICVPIFSQNRQLLIFRSKFGEIAQLRAIFWFKYCWGCCRELGGGGWSWVEVEMSWVEVDEASWGWVHGLIIPLLNRDEGKM